ncbi:methyltransferase [Maridesulfovibrio zosterae]|uniref:methyltransferase n=1 Tax=Maridesulfovibrio zosterae TaxID=82171 RepID=UPI0003FF26F8|nr:methyltransferase [Maridesulfovibrio zosterae]
MFIAIPENDFGPVRKLIMESITPKLIIAAVKLKLFDFISDIGTTAGDLADDMGLEAVRLEPVLDVLVASEILEFKDGIYRNTSLAVEYLVSTSPLYQGKALQLSSHFNSLIEDSIPELLAGGEMQREVTDSEWGAEDAIEGTAQDAMSSGLAPVVDCISRLPGFDDFTSMCDIGGNHGLYTLGVLERNSKMEGVIYDLPHVLDLVQSRCNNMGFRKRITTSAFNFREDRLPESQYDIAVMSHILYAMKKDLSNAVKKIAETLKPGGWFVSHHYTRYEKSADLKAKASLEALTRLCGYSSHFIEKDELTKVLLLHGFENIRYENVSENGFGLITMAQLEKR